MARGSVHLVAIVEWFIRRVLAWRVSISLDVEFCIEVLKEALARYGKPSTFTRDQGSQFTSVAFTAVLLRKKIAIGMDGKGCWRDGVFVEGRKASGAQRNTRRFTSTPTPRPPRLVPASAATTPSGRTPRLAVAPDQVYFHHPLLAAA
jgi:putative transposase